ncbi:MAG: hypothetical protein ACM32H_01265 [Candidatus Aminicenantes bacterium RBG_16_66_30]
MREGSRASYKAFSLGLAVVFALVGGVFLFLPRETLAFFNDISRRLGMTEGPAERSFFGVLAAAYMYVVTILAWSMYRFPGERIYPLILCQAKLASSLLSFLMFFFHAPWLIYLVNGIVDGGIGLAVLALFLKARGAAAGGAG